MTQITSPGASGYDRQNLTSEEQGMLQTTLERALEDTRTEGTTTLQNKVEEYWEEVGFTAEVARAQFDQRFQGQNPDSGFFGVDTIFPGYFGYEDWSNVTDPTSGDVGNTVAWLDDSQDLLTGTGGRNNPIRTGEDVVHIIFGVTSYAQSPKASRIWFVKNDSPRSAFSTDEMFRNTDLRTQWLNSPIVLAEDDDLYAEFVAGAEGYEALALRGLTFIKEKPSRVRTPQQMVDDELVLETS